MLDATYTFDQLVWFGCVCFAAGSLVTVAIGGVLAHWISGHREPDKHWPSL